MQELRHHEVGGVTGDFLAEEDDAIVEQAAVDVVASLAARGLLDDIRDVGDVANRVDHVVLHCDQARMSRPPCLAGAFASQPMLASSLGEKKPGGEITPPGAYTPLWE